MKSKSVIIQMKATEQYFLVLLLVCSVSLLCGRMVKGYVHNRFQQKHFIY